MMYIILWSFTYIIYWVKHEATLLGIAEFLIPILILPIVCSAYGEVNYEGKRMLRVCRHAKVFLTTYPIMLNVEKVSFKFIGKGHYMVKYSQAGIYF